MSKSSQFSRQILVIGAIFYLFTLSTASARQQLHGHVPKEANASSYIGAIEPTASLNLAIGLPLQNQNELQQFLNDVYNPQSPLFHHFLTSDQFAQQYGPTDSDYQAVIDFAKAHNLTVTNTYTNHLLIDVQGSVSDIQKTFHVNLNRYRRQDGSEFHAPDQEPSVDLDVLLTHISGLENFHVPKPAFSATKMDAFTAKSQNSSLAHPNAGSGVGGRYLGSDFRNAYFPTCVSSLEGAGQTVALVEFDGYTASDITTYKNDTGYPTSPLLTNIFLDSFNGTAGSNNGEVALDIEMVFAMAPLAQIYVVEGTLGNSILSNIATSPAGHLANQISCSWSFSDGSPGPDITTANLIQEFASQGQSYFQSSGDNGSYVGINTVPGPIDLTSEMTVVGGSQLTTGIGSTYTSEATWNDSFGESGGGICNSSTPVPIPTYQIPFDSTNTTFGNGASNLNRNIPDVSMVATNIESIATTVIHGVTTTGVIFKTAGTSCSTPLWAGFTALINEEAYSAVKGPMGFMNPFLYNLASNATTYANDFNDIQTGNNNSSGSGLYPAVKGYDLATGLGSPKCNMLTDLIAPLNTNTVTPTPTNTRTPTITPTPTMTPTITMTPTPPTTTSSYAFPQPAHGGQVYICYNSPIAQQVRINIYSVSGQQVDSVMDNPVDSNQNRVLISLQGFVPSVYFYVINGLTSGVLAKGKFLVVP